jgi:chromosome segregation ATPase
VTGKNGSGKSAILEAIIVCLAKKKNIKYPIRNGSSKATIEIVLFNGVNGYKFEIFGRTITIKRYLFPVVHDSYRSQLQIDHFIPSEKKTAEYQLEKILSHFNILVGNSMVIMQQETSKNFISHQTPSSLYQMFKQASLISLIEKKFNETKEIFNECSNNKKELEEELKVENHKSEILFSKLTKIAEFEIFFRNLEEAEAKLIWSPVNCCFSKYTNLEEEKKSLLIKLMF